MPIVDGLALYFRKLSRARHGTPQALAERCRALGLSWVAIGGPWQARRGNGRLEARPINTPRQCRDYGDALAAAGITPYVWGYPWQGGEAEFCAQMLESAGPRGLVLIDPELGSNPARSTKPAAKKRADEHAQDLVKRLRDGGAQRVGLSTFGAVPPWFPLRAFLRAGIDFAGGQTYTDNAAVRPSITSFAREIAGFGNPGVELVPSFGLYSFGPSKAARAKSPDELRSHLLCFIDQPCPVHALIGWAETFLTKSIEPELPKFAALMQRGATRLPAAAPPVA